MLLSVLPNDRVLLLNKQLSQALCLIVAVGVGTVFQGGGNRGSSLINLWGKDYAELGG